MLISILTLATASLLPFSGQIVPTVAGTSASLPSYPTYEKHYSTTMPLHVQFLHRGSGRCEQPNCNA